MKNFRKVLALILVVATLFSFVAMASAKTLEDYSDADQVKYVEAVDVLSALGIINGYDGAFHPLDNIDRDEMAKMVAVLHNAGDFDADLYVSANKFADAKGSWAEGYIAYCTQVGIIAGRNASTFDPEGKVTGVEVLKMLLCTLGYKAAEQGYVGANWQVNVLRDAKKADLLTGLAGMDIYAAATRDEAAQMFLNALKANLVYGYLSENVAKLTNSLYPVAMALVQPDGTVETQIIYQPATPDANMGDRFEQAYCNAILSRFPLWTIFGGAFCSSEMLDCFGRPSTLWEIRNNHNAVILSKTYPAVPDFEFTNNVKLETELNKIFTSKNAPAVTTYRNGRQETAHNTLARASRLTGNGVKTEVFIKDASVIVVIIETFIGQVDSITKHPATVTLTNGYTFANNYGLKVDDYVMYHKCAGAEGPMAGGIVVPGNHEDAIRVKTPAGAWMLDTAGKQIWLHDVELALPTVEPIVHASLGLQATYLEDSYFQTDAAKFEYAKTFMKELGIDRVTATGVIPYSLYTDAEIYEFLLRIYDITPDDHDYDVYVNEYGYVMFLEPHVDEIEYKYGYMVEDTQDADALTIVNGETVRNYALDIVNFDGTEGAKTAEVDQATERLTWLASGIINGGAIEDPSSDYGWTDFLGRLARYYINEEGQIEVDPTIGCQWAVEAPVGAYVVPGVSTIYGVTNNTQLEDGLRARADRDTEYMVRTWDWATQTYNYNVYIGYQNLPNTLFGTKPIGSIVTDTTTGTAIASMQYIINDLPDTDDEDAPFNCIASHIFIDATFEGTDEVFYILDPLSHDTELRLYPWLAGYVVYEALIDGQKAAVAATDIVGTGLSNNGVAAPLSVHNTLYRATIKVIDGVTINGLPLYVAPKALAPVNWTLIDGPIDGLLTVEWLIDGEWFHGHYQIAPEAPIYVIFRGWDADTETFNDVQSYRTFSGETRDEDFDNFFLHTDYRQIRVYTTEVEVGDPVWGEVNEITAMWVEVIARGER